MKADMEFSAKLWELETAQKTAPAAPPVLKIEDREAYEIVMRFFIGLEKDTQDSWNDREMNLFSRGSARGCGESAIRKHRIRGNKPHGGRMRTDTRLECLHRDEELNAGSRDHGIEAVEPTFARVHMVLPAAPDVVAIHEVGALQEAVGLASQFLHFTGAEHLA
ncbi:MAG: hypothetical protein WDN28_03110 [Chthoniobacter sp.]